MENGVRHHANKAKEVLGTKTVKKGKKERGQEAPHEK
jgi:hypothetical protein